MKFLFCLLAVGLVSFADGDKSSKGPATHVYQYENVLGTSMTLKVIGVSQAESGKVESAVLAEIGRLSAILSGYDANSEFSRWFRTSGKAVRVSPELYEVLALFDQWRNRTGGALDASAEVVTKCWKAASAQGRVPTPDELQAAVARVQQPHWRLDPGGRTAIHLSDAPLMLNSFAKSYIIRHAADAGLAAANAAAIVVNIGGDMVISGRHTEEVLVSDPKSDAENDLPLYRLRVSNRAVATSGNYRRGEMIGGKWYSHIVDPRTRVPADGVVSATVVAPNATDAGALATVFNVVSPEESVRLAAAVPGVDYLIITRDGKRVESPGWKSLEMDERPMTTGSGYRLVVPGSEEFELAINLEINVQQGFAKRPYVAVWVEDENHAPVRTVSVWHGSERYLPELKSWYLKNRGRYSDDQNFASSVTSATRSAGKYSLKWDGKDDQGSPVKPGKYVIKIEASREHGTYQLLRQEIEWNATPRKYDLNGGAELSGVSLDYRKKSNE
jgi:thiamine biosynthesis lipoprotein